MEFLIETEKLLVLETTILSVTILVSDGFGDQYLFADDQFVLVDHQILLLLVHFELNPPGHGSIVSIDEGKGIALAWLSLPIALYSSMVCNTLIFLVKSYLILL
jgi:hypothetical protein